MMQHLPNSGKKTGIHAGRLGQRLLKQEYAAVKVWRAKFIDEAVQS
jgi:hypothetical protein